MKATPLKKNGGVAFCVLPAPVARGQHGGIPPLRIAVQPTDLSRCHLDRVRRLKAFLSDQLGRQRRQFCRLPEQPPRGPMPAWFASLPGLALAAGMVNGIVDAP